MPGCLRSCSIARRIGRNQRLRQPPLLTLEGLGMSYTSYRHRHALKEREKGDHDLSGMSMKAVLTCDISDIF